MIIFTGRANMLDKIQDPFMIKTLRKLRIEMKFLNLVKIIYEKPVANITLTGKRLEYFPLRSGKRQGWLL